MTDLQEKIKAYREMKRLAEEGVNPKIVQERLGHAKVQITLDTYECVKLGRTTFYKYFSKKQVSTPG